MEMGGEFALTESMDEEAFYAAIQNLSNSCSTGITKLKLTRRDFYQAILDLLIVLLFRIVKRDNFYVKYNDLNLNSY